LSYGVVKQPLNEYVKIGNAPSSSSVKIYYGTVNDSNEVKFRTNINTTSIWVSIEGNNFYATDDVFELTHVALKKDVTVKWCPHNLLIRSEELNLWTQSGTGSVVVDNAVAPDGTTTAATLTMGSTTALRYILSSGTYTTGDIITYSFWARSDTVTSIGLGINGGASTGNNAIYSNLAVTSTWNLVEFEFTILETDSSSLYYIIGKQGDNPVNNQLGDIEIWHPHVYRSDMEMANNPDTNDSYVPTTNSPVYSPRVGHYVYDKFTGWVNEGLLHESEARTNVVFPSADFSNSNWIKHNNITVSTGSYNGDKNPDGVAYAQYVNDDSQVGYLELNTPNNLTSDHVRSIWAKSQSEGTVGLLTDYRNAGSEVTLTTEWKRFDIKVPSTDVNSGSFIAVDFRIGNLTRVWIWGAQAELGDYVSSYIPTSGSQVTRAADILTVPAANLPYSSTNVSIQMDGKMTYADNNLAYSTGHWTAGEATWFRWSAASTEFLYAGIHTVASRTGQMIVSQRTLTSAFSSTTNAFNYFTPNTNVPFNIATRHSSTFLNGAEGGIALTAATPTDMPDLSNSNLELGFKFMGTIGKFRVWDEDLGDTGIAEASAPSTEPSLQLTFDGLSTNSFTVLDWSE